MKKPSTYCMLVLALLVSLNSFSIPKLNSFPAAVATIYLDFDGHTVNSSVWNSGLPLLCAPSGMCDSSITEVFNRVSEDYRPFAINITTDSTVFLAAPLDKRIRVIITPTSGWYPGVGGISYISSFIWGDDTPAFVFCNLLGPNSPKMVAECCSHESGHTLGLSHQSVYDASNCSIPTLTYNPGVGAGEIGWAPIMGNSYYKNMSTWNNGPTPYGCTSAQDNLTILSTQNGFGFRPDDFGETLNASTHAVAANNFSVSGLIATNTDKDAFRIQIGTNSNFHLAAIPGNVGANYIGSNLDIKVELYNGLGTLIRTYDPTATMDVTVDTILNAGTYYIKIDGTGNANVGDYGSLGSYTLNGTSGTLPIHDVSLKGTVDKAKHNLNWKVIADEPIRSIVVERSIDGTQFDALTSLTGNDNNFSYLPYQTGVMYYRLKVTSVLNQIMYSNTLALKATDKPEKLFTVSTLVQQAITVNAAANFQYLLSDMNGRTVSTGKAFKGINNIPIANQPGGMYVIQLFADNSNGSTNERQTERIIKQ